MGIDYNDDVDMMVQAWGVEPADRVPGAPRIVSEVELEQGC